MAARATRSASRVASSSDDDSRSLLLALSHDELGVIVDGLADPLQPVVAVAFSSTCLGLRTPLQAALEVLKERHARAVTLCRKARLSCAELRDADNLIRINAGLTADDMATLSMILQTNGLPKLQHLTLFANRFGDAGLQALCEGLGKGAAPSLLTLHLGQTDIGPAGAEALAAAISKGAMPRLVRMLLNGNSIGNQGAAALAAPLRKLPALRDLDLVACKIGDEDVASLVANLGKDDFKALEDLALDINKITDAGCATLARVLRASPTALPLLTELALYGNPASVAAQKQPQAVLDGL